jgi:vitamin B12/bleomycin/antimicrobial peptide transport system ATP-binding/permease protein
METSRDWSNELSESLKWIVVAFGITAVCFVIAAALLLRYTRWGRQFWKISGQYFVGPGGGLVCLHVGALLLLVVCLVRVNVLITYWSNDLYTSLQFGAQALAAGDGAALEAAKAGFWSAMWLFGVLATIHVVRALVSIYLSQAFDIRWRVWLTERFTSDWMAGRAYYRGRFIDSTIDNPDQRIQQDITDFAVTSRQLSVGGGTAPGAVGSILSVVSFTQILWELSGPLTVFGVEIPRAMMFLVLVYVLVTTVIAFWIGYPLIQLNFLRERVTANFRYALVRLRDSAENVAFYRGERVERGGLLSRFAAVIRNAWRIVFRNLKFTAWNFGVNQASVIFPYLVQGPRFFTGAITLGDLQQTGRAFTEIHDSLSFFRESYDDFTAYRASLLRLDGLREASLESRRLPRITVSAMDGGVELVDVSVRRPEGEVLIEDLSLRLRTGDSLVVKGPSGSGKTTLLRSLAEMWPYADGELRRPDGDATLFLSQMPYLPLGDLRTAVTYPGPPGDLDDDTIREVLRKVQLGNLVDRLDEEQDWATILSPGEQQRVAFARILLLRPALVFLDEATSAVDEGLEYSLYDLIRTEVPDCILFSVSHRSTVDQHHARQLELSGDGSWELSLVSV